jgi:hypothetical protein
MNRDKELYRQLRKLSWGELWTGEVPRFNSASARERLERVAVIRAVGVVFAESAAREQLDEVKAWLRSLLNDPQEKIRRYAVAALPKLPRDASDEHELLGLAKKAVSDREKQHVASALSKIGGSETLRHAHDLPPRALQKVKASVLRAESASAINLNAILKDFGGVEVLLRGRAGLETFVRDEARDFIRAHGKFKLRETKTSLVILTPTAPFALAELFSMRCFDNVAFALPLVGNSEPGQIAATITSPTSLRILRTFTSGPIRYRLDFVDKGHKRAAVRQLAELIYSRERELINGGGDTPWTIEISPLPKALALCSSRKYLPTRGSRTAAATFLPPRTRR